MDLLFKKEDILILDGILECLVRSDVGVCATDTQIQMLVPMGDASKGVDEFEKPLIYYFNYFQLNDVGDVDTSESYTIYTLLKMNKKTLAFYKNGGFEKLYNNKIKEKEQQEKQQELIQKQIVEIKRNKWIAITALVISLISLLYPILKEILQHFGFY